MSVYIASMNLRGKWALSPEYTMTVNVTSAQQKSSKNRRDFSPMTPIEGGYKGYWNFESYWQSGKVFEDIPEEKVKSWWKKLAKPKRRYPNSKHKKILYSHFVGYDPMDYITSRKKIYVPEYYELIKNREMTLYWKNMVSNNVNVAVYDFDGPRKDDGEVTCLKVTKELLIEKINDIKFPFGHGYIVAGLLAGITPEYYV